MKKKGIFNIQNLVEFLPRAYEDRRANKTISSLQVGESVSLVVTLQKISSFNLGRSFKKAHSLIVSDNTGRISCKFFRTPFKGYFSRFEEFQRLQVIGKVIEYKGVKEIHHPEIVIINDDFKSEDKLVPIYSVTENLNSKKMSTLIETAFKELERDPEFLSVFESMPSFVLDKYNLCSKYESLINLHNPPPGESENLLEGRSSWHRRLIFEEFFWLEIFVQAKRRGIKKEIAPKMDMNLLKAKELRASLPFTLTNDQVVCFKQIVKDMISGHPMHRMVQGDVGAGKTIVALLAVCLSFENNFQSAMMAPTEILAEQHFKNCKKWLEPLGIKTALLVGALKKKEKQEIYDKLISGEIHFLVGTHALIQEAVKFKNLALVIIDEQHRFGVQQRNILKQKGLSPHFLLMTATPIPRSLAMTVYGDLDVSQIKEKPTGRLPIKTKLIFSNKKSNIDARVEEELNNGRQVYFVYPLVSESEKLDLKNAESEYEMLKLKYPKLSIGLLHGQMKSGEKDQIMRQFRDGEYNALVSTTVIEVGVDVPNATVMVIENCERFGLSQLHQLRGRVGRSVHQSYCFLVLNFPCSNEAKARNRFMETTEDGFKISEYDLKMRGPGQFMGAQQSGLVGFKVANLVRDQDILSLAKEAAEEVLDSDPSLKLPVHKKIRDELNKTYGDKILAFVG